MTSTLQRGSQGHGRHREHAESCTFGQPFPPWSLSADICAWVPARETFTYIPTECEHSKIVFVFMQHRLFDAEIHIKRFVYKFAHRETFQRASGEVRKSLRGLEIQTGLSEQVGINEHQKRGHAACWRLAKDP